MMVLLGLDMDNFEDSLRRIINAHGIDSRLGIPDFILARFIKSYVDSLENLTNECDIFFEQNDK